MGPLEIIKTGRDGGDLKVTEKFLRVRFTQDFPAFVGFDMETYGPYTAGEEAVIPYRNALLLYEQGVLDAGFCCRVERRPLKKVKTKQVSLLAFAVSEHKG